MVYWAGCGYIVNMSIQLPDNCLRELNDCEPLSQIESDCKESFWCCGLNDGTTRVERGDIYRLCFKNGVIDDMTDNSNKDMFDLVSVISLALSVKAHRDVVGMPPKWTR